ncbi:MAG: hypothetical protein Q9162_004140 [Coniocarpon cinnabarinum]
MHSVTTLQLLACFTCLDEFRSRVYAQSPIAEPQLDTFNGSAYRQFTSTSIRLAGFDNTTSEAIQVANDFERSNWATGSVFDDSFYTLSSNASGAQPGDFLKAEAFTNATQFTLPPNLAVSRFLYQTETLNGSSVPNSAFVLWPWSARQYKNISGYPVVVWAHGTSGRFPECAPTHIRNLWYQFSAPFTLALQGYVVIGVDYAGLGVGETASNETIAHQWGANPAGANDMFNAVAAAQKRWPSLSREFVTMGHSQGGGIAWSAAVRQAQRPVEGYLGSIAGSPLTDFNALSAVPLAATGLFIAYLTPTIASVFPEFDEGDWLTDDGLRRLSLFQDLNGCQSTNAELFPMGTSAAKPGWNETWYLSSFNDLISVGGKPISGPLLVLQGTADPTVDPTGTTIAVNQTCNTRLDANVHYAMFEGVTHVPVMFSAQQMWLDWIAARFNGEATEPSCSNELQRPIQPVQSYETEINYFLEYPLYAYETA